jgi:hypothetical protein
MAATQNGAGVLLRCGAVLFELYYIRWFPSLGTEDKSREISSLSPYGIDGLVYNSMNMYIPYFESYIEYGLIAILCRLLYNVSSPESRNLLYTKRHLTVSQPSRYSNVRQHRL